MAAYIQQALWNGYNRVKQRTIQYSPEPPLTSGCLNQMWCGGRKKRMGACYCIAWTCIRTDTLTRLAVYSFVVAVSRDPTSTRPPLFPNSLCSSIWTLCGLDCEILSNANIFCLALWFTFILPFLCQVKLT